MNAARQRRKARLLRLNRKEIGPWAGKDAPEPGSFTWHLMRAMNPGQNESPVEDVKREEKFVTAYVDLKSGATRNLIEVKLPKEHLTQKIKEMNANGFWSPEADGAIYVPPDQIMRVLVYT